MKRDLAIVCVSFVSTRVFFRVVGIEFDATPLSWFFQILDPLHLQTDLVRSLIYLHSQPPGFNLFLGLIMLVSGGCKVWLFARVYEIIGLTSIIAIYLIGRRLDIPRLVCLLAPILFMITPPAILYENWLFYTLPVMSMLVISAVFLQLYIARRHLLHGMIFFALLAGIVCTRTLFHTAWFIIIAAAMIIRSRENWKKTILCAVLPFLVIAGLHLKNFVLFGQVNLSSWFGMNIAKMTLSIPMEKMKPLTDSGKVSQIVLIEPFQSPEAYASFARFDTTTGIPVLDQPYKSTGYVNFNHVGYLAVSREYGLATSALMRKYPAYYGLSVTKALYKYLRPCSDSTIFPGENRYRIAHWVTAYHRYLVGDILKNVWSATFTNRYGQMRTIHLNFLYVFLPIVILWALYLSTRGRQKHGVPSDKMAVYRFMTFNLIYVTVIGNLFEMSENMRFRFLVLPFIYIFIMSMFKYFFNKKQ